MSRQQRNVPKKGGTNENIIINTNIPTNNTNLTNMSSSSSSPIPILSSSPKNKIAPFKILNYATIKSVKLSTLILKNEFTNVILPTTSLSTQALTFDSNILQTPRHSYRSKISVGKAECEKNITHAIFKIFLRPRQETMEQKSNGERLPMYTNFQHLPKSLDTKKYMEYFFLSDDRLALKNINIQQGSENWVNLRAMYISATGMPLVMKGEGDKYLQDKFSNICFKPNKFMLFGSENESDGLSQFIRYYKNHSGSSHPNDIFMLPNFIIHRFLSYLGATPDLIILHPDGSLSIIDNKCPNLGQTTVEHPYSAKGSKKYLGYENFHEDYLIQLHTIAGCFLSYGYKIRHLWLVAYQKEKTWFQFINFNENIWNDIYIAAQTFFQNQFLPKLVEKYNDGSKVSQQVLTTILQPSTTSQTLATSSQAKLKAKVPTKLQASTISQDLTKAQTGTSLASQAHILLDDAPTSRKIDNKRSRVPTPISSSSTTSSPMSRSILPPPRKRQDVSNTPHTVSTNIVSHSILEKLPLETVFVSFEHNRNFRQLLKTVLRHTDQVLKKEPIVSLNAYEKLPKLMDTLYIFIVKTINNAINARKENCSIRTFTTQVQELASLLRVFKNVQDIVKKVDREISTITDEVDWKEMNNYQVKVDALYTFCQSVVSTCISKFLSSYPKVHEILTANLSAKAFRKCILNKDQFYQQILVCIGEYIHDSVSMQMKLDSTSTNIDPTSTRMKLDSPSFYSVPNKSESSSMNQDSHLI